MLRVATGSLDCVIVTSVAESAVKAESICDEAVAVSPNTATRTPTPSTVPRPVSSVRPGTAIYARRDGRLVYGHLRWPHTELADEDAA